MPGGHGTCRGCDGSVPESGPLSRSTCCTARTSTACWRTSGSTRGASIQRRLTSSTAPGTFLPPWPDSVPGITELKRDYIVGPLSNGNTSLLLDMAKAGGLAWDLILGADVTKAYKPTMEAYLRPAAVLGLEPGEAPRRPQRTRPTWPPPAGGPGCGVHLQAPGARAGDPRGRCCHQVVGPVRILHNRTRADVTRPAPKACTRSSDAKVEDAAVRLEGAAAMILPTVRDPRFMTIRRGGTLTDSDHRLLALWAASCAETSCTCSSRSGRRTRVRVRRSSTPAPGCAVRSRRWRHARRVATQGAARA